MERPILDGAEIAAIEAALKAGGVEFIDGEYHGVRMKRLVLFIQNLRLSSPKPTLPPDEGRRRASASVPCRGFCPLMAKKKSQPAAKKTHAKSGTLSLQWRNASTTGPKVTTTIRMPITCARSSPAASDRKIETCGAQ